MSSKIIKAHEKWWMHSTLGWPNQKDILLHWNQPIHWQLHQKVYSKWLKLWFWTQTLVENGHFAIGPYD